MAVYYEWDIETVDPESDDILDHNFCRSAEEAISYCDSDGMRIVLVRDSWRDGRLKRSWAYVEYDRSLPETFDDGTPVPRKYREEWKKAVVAS